MLRNRAVVSPGKLYLLSPGPTEKYREAFWRQSKKLFPEALSIHNNLRTPTPAGGRASKLSHHQGAKNRASLMLAKLVVTKYECVCVGGGNHKRLYCLSFHRILFSRCETCTLPISQ